MNKKIMSLGDRMKQYEKTSYEITNIKPYLPFIVRMDGNCFSKFTRGFDKPFDELFAMAMIKTSGDLLIKFSSVTSLVFSDEISLVIPAICSKKDYESDNKKYSHIYSGKQSKIISLTAGYCSVRFNYHLINLIENEKRDIKIYKKIKLMNAFFDSRIVVFQYETSEIEITNYILWRSVYDCYRNCISTYADYYVGKKKTFKKNGKEKIIMLEKNGVNWNKDVPTHYKHGTFIKKELYDKTLFILNKKTNVKQYITCKRSRTVPFTIKIENTDKLIIKIIMSKYLFDEKSLIEKLYFEQKDILNE